MNSIFTQTHRHTHTHRGYISICNENGLGAYQTEITTRSGDSKRNKPKTDRGILSILNLPYNFKYSIVLYTHVLF